jgi:hypothetical protein
MISKNGKTKTSNKLIKLLRKNSKHHKIIGGAFLNFLRKKDNSKTNSNSDDSIQNNTSTNSTEENVKLSKVNQMENIEKKAENVRYAIIGAELLVTASAPLLAASGVGIPLLAILVVVRKLATQYKQNIELNIVLHDVSSIIVNCFLLESLIKVTMQTFKPYVEDATNEKNNNSSQNSMEESQTDSTNISQSETTNNSSYNSLSNSVNSSQIESSSNSPSSQNSINSSLLRTANNLQSIIAKAMIPKEKNKSGGSVENRINISNNIITRIQAKLDTLNKLLQTIAPIEKDSTFSKVTKKFKRFFFSKQLKNDVLNELTIVNGLFTIYNSQFDWSLRYYENIILKYSKNGKEVLEQIWSNIETTDEYKNYLFQNEESVYNIIENATPEVINNVNKEIDENRPTESSTSKEGGSKTKKKIKHNKKYTRKRK